MEIQKINNDSKKNIALEIILWADLVKEELTQAVLAEYINALLEYPGIEKFIPKFRKEKVFYRGSNTPRLPLPAEIISAFKDSLNSQYAPLEEIDFNIREDATWVFLGYLAATFQINVDECTKLIESGKFKISNDEFKELLDYKKTRTKTQIELYINSRFQNIISRFKKIGVESMVE